MRWSFDKYVGCGNDFIVFDNRQDRFPLSQPTTIQRLCHRQWGIGADGILLLELSSRADCSMRIFNADGSEAEMCGNGLRCFVKWLEARLFKSQTYQIEVMHQIYRASITDTGVSIEMIRPTHAEWDLSLPYQNQELRVHHLNTGVPHTILFVEDVETIDMKALGAFIRYHEQWQPKGTNFSVAQRTEQTRFKMRTYERGVEGETLACGTGATAVALTAAYQYRLNGPVTIETRSGNDLEVSFERKGEEFSKVHLCGAAEFVFRGEIEL